MDERRLNTEEVLQRGILNITPPETNIPRERDTTELAEDRTQIIAALEDGKLVTARNYYGIPYAWKENDETYRGVLLQYRAISEDLRFPTAEEAADWFAATFVSTY